MQFHGFGVCRAKIYLKQAFYWWTLYLGMVRPRTCHKFMVLEILRNSSSSFTMPFIWPLSTTNQSIRNRFAIPEKKVFRFKKSFLIAGVGKLLRQHGIHVQILIRTELSSTRWSNVIKTWRGGITMSLAMFVDSLIERKNNWWRKKRWL